MGLTLIKNNIYQFIQIKYFVFLMQSYCMQIQDTFIRLFPQSIIEQNKSIWLFFNLNYLKTRRTSLVP